MEQKKSTTVSDPINVAVIHYKRILGLTGFNNKTQLEIEA